MHYFTLKDDSHFYCMCLPEVLDLDQVPMNSKRRRASGWQVAQLFPQKDWTLCHGRVFMHAKQRYLGLA